MVGKFDVKSLLIADPYLAMGIFSAYNICVIFFLLNIFLSIIGAAFEQTRYDERNAPAKFDIFDYLTAKTRHFLRMKEDKMQKAHAKLNQSKRYIDFVNQMPDKVEDLLYSFTKVNGNSSSFFLNFSNNKIYFFLKIFEKELKDVDLANIDTETNKKIDMNRDVNIHDILIERKKQYYERNKNYQNLYDFDDDNHDEDNDDDNYDDNHQDNDDNDYTIKKDIEHKKDEKKKDKYKTTKDTLDKNDKYKNDDDKYKSTNDKKDKSYKNEYDDKKELYNKNDDENDVPDESTYRKSGKKRNNLWD
jgi:hypothetical protein